jgi:urate oxidase
LTQSYGKSRVRLTKVDRDTDVHQLTELSVDVELDGDFNAAYTRGDNSLVIPTDTMKNTVYSFARELDPCDLETFAWTLGSHFVENFEHVSHAAVKIVETPWQRVVIDGEPHPHAFLGTSTERNICQAVISQPKEGDEPEGAIECGLEGLILLKTTDSGFSKFLKDDFTTLPEEITLSMPNLHRPLIDLEPLELDNPNTLFIPTDEPHGSITATITREHPQ